MRYGKYRTPFSRLRVTGQRQNTLPHMYQKMIEVLEDYTFHQASGDYLSSLNKQYVV